MDTEVPKWRENVKIIAEILYNFAVIVVIVAIIRYTLISPFQVSGSSMFPNLKNNEFLIVDKLSYFLHQPVRGDIIVLIPPENTDTFYVKRIIGLPGEKVEFLNGQVIIHDQAHPEGVRLEEPYLAPENIQSYLPTHENKIIDVPTDNYFVMGDNRHASNDSRSWGLLHRRSIEGRAWFIFYPFNSIRLVPHMDYISTDWNPKLMNYPHRSPDFLGEKIIVPANTTKIEIFGGEFDSYDFRLALLSDEYYQIIRDVSQNQKVTISVKYDLSNNAIREPALDPVLAEELNYWFKKDPTIEIHFYSENSN